MISRRRAFTLVELLVVISIITLLIAMLLPALGKSREATESAICGSHMRQCGIAAQSYTDDHASKFPSAFNWVLHVTCWHDWHQMERIEQGLMFQKGYITDRNLYMCPSFLKTWTFGDRPPGHCTEPMETLTPAYSYSMNASVGWQGWAGYRWPKFEDIKKPVKTLFISEEANWAVPPWGGVSINNAAIGLGADTVASYHFMSGTNLRSGKGNVCFFDLHVELRQPSDTNSMCAPP